MTTSFILKILKLQ